MSNDYVFSKCTRRCAVSGRPLEPGESFVSVLIPKGDEVSRIDIAATHWTGPQPETIGWWRGKMPAAAAKKLRPAPSGVLMDTLSSLLDQPGKEPLAYLLALLLTRRRILTEEERLQLEPDAEPETLWRLVCPADGRQWNVPVVVPSPELLNALQEELNSLLFTEE